ncbi:MAG TPA: preprotein translocase subunit SecG [Hyphomicrobiales bacterium]|nr:preprotein translocase subunit SecG [Hyphomicrobiales bacterium]
METVLIVVHLMIVIALVGTVLLQRSEGGALGIGGGGGGGGFMTGRGAANALTRASAILAAAFFATSIALTLMATQRTGQPSILEGVGPAETGQPAEGEGGTLPLLRREQPEPAAPEVPALPQVPQSQ